MIILGPKPGGGGDKIKSCLECPEPHITMAIRLVAAKLKTDKNKSISKKTTKIAFKFSSNTYFNYFA